MKKQSEPLPGIKGIKCMIDAVEAQRRGDKAPEFTDADIAAIVDFIKWYDSSTVDFTEWYYSEDRD